MIQKQNKKSRMKSFKYVQFVIRRLCTELFYYNMPHLEVVDKCWSVECWLRCENALGRIDDDCLQKAFEYSALVIRNIVKVEKKGDDRNAD